MATTSPAPLLFDPLRRPPSPDGMRVGTSLALLVHVGLIAALAYGVAWRRHDVQTLSAELWAAVPQVAAPMAPELPPPPPAPPSPPPKPVPAPPPPPPPKAEAPSRDADIALDKARKKAQAERDAAEKAADKKKADDKKAAEKLAEKKAQDERDRREAEAKAKADKEKAQKLADKAAEKAAEKAADKKDAADKAKAAAAEKAQNERLATLRAENLLRMNKELGTNPAVGNGAANSTGTAAQSAAPSASYAGRLRAYLIPKIVYTGPRDRSMQADVEVRLAPDGTILGSRLIKSSGQPGWDAAVLQVLEKVGTLPRDTDGRVQPIMVLTLDPGNS